MSLVCCGCRGPACIKDTPIFVGFSGPCVRYRAPEIWGICGIWRAPLFLLHNRFIRADSKLSAPPLLLLPPPHPSWSRAQRPVGSLRVRRRSSAPRAAPHASCYCSLAAFYTFWGDRARHLRGTRGESLRQVATAIFGGHSRALGAQHLLLERGLLRLPQHHRERGDTKS